MTVTRSLGTFVTADAVEPGELVFRAGQVDCESFDLTEPAFAFSVVYVGEEAVPDLLQTGRWAGSRWMSEQRTRASSSRCCPAASSCRFG